LNLNKLNAGMYSNNPGSYRAFLKCGFNEVGRRKKSRLFKNRFVDEILVEKSRRK
jgi:RimJ/RimL family protein N-acetyltransferase